MTSKQPQEESRQHSKATGRPGKKRYVPAVGNRLKKLLAVVFGLFALLAVNSSYLVGVSILEWVSGQVYQNWFYLIMFLVHLGLGLLFVLPVIIFGILHMRNAYQRRNRRAVKVGYALFGTAVLLLVSGFVLMRGDFILFQIDVKNPALRTTAYWAHVLAPLVAAWLFVLHRLAGRRIRWKVGAGWAAAAVAFAGLMLILQAQDPRAWNQVGNPKGEQYFFPSLARTVSGDFIPARVLDNNEYCKECHADVHETWSYSVHRFASFNNPAYLASVRATRKKLFARDGNVKGARFCAGCHDPLPFYSGEFDKPHFDDPDYDLASDRTANAGITCTVCHSITNINTPRGNSDYTIDEPIHYPFAFSENRFLKWTNRQLVKAKPEFHKKTFLKPLHRTTEFCGTCHKVHLPEELNAYKWLRGQNHQDAFWLSGVSGHSPSSFYYPPKAESNCNNCHMQLKPSEDFGAKDYDGTGIAKVHDHQFPSANTAIPHLLQFPEWVNDRHREFLDGVMRVDIFGLKQDGQIDGELTAPLDPQAPALSPGRRYLLETVIRTVKMGHLFTQGTADSNEVWLDVEVTSGGRVIGRSGAMDPAGQVDPWSHFVNAYVIDRNGNRIAFRNAEDIFIALYNNQIPPGAADVVHYKLDVPRDVGDEITVRATLKYRKFDTTYLRFFQDDPDAVNDLPVTVLASDTVTFPVAGRQTSAQGPEEGAPDEEADGFPTWQRWNDYGIGLLRKGGQGELRQAAQAFREVERLGNPSGPLNLARVFIREGLIQQDAPQALARAESFDPAAPAWTLLWLGALVDKENGNYEAAQAKLADLIQGGFAQAQGRGFDFSKDYRVLVEMGEVMQRQALTQRGEHAQREATLREAEKWFLGALEYDPENLSAHWGLKQVYQALRERDKERRHAELHAKYKPDDNARDRAITAARRLSPPADHAAEAVVIYDLNRQPE
ncbi:MAG TPA: multiheme c-type cytochrome [Acidobacteriota bacterium]|nr:multiheme c-type cytochrome [Acidobacteriota bacterium]